VLQVSIIPRTHKMLGFAQYMPEERKLLSQDAVSVTTDDFLLYFYFAGMYTAFNVAFVLYCII